ncbi:MAG: class I SAM-dependent methyltransferase, partial [Deltaproteobacteria bacterium]|nr:class I SAM-dependent methyltransferase [Deltaproteobacteria bacterium]
MSNIAEAKRLIEEMNAYYDRHAPWHDQCMGYESNDNMEKLLTPIIKVFERHIRNKDVLEIACGTGNWTQFLAKRARSVLAVDMSPAALKIARTKISEYKNVSLGLANAYSLDGVCDLFDLVFAADWWSHIPKS